MDNGHILIRKAHLSLWLRWAKKDKGHRDRLTLTGAELVSAGPGVGLVTWATPQPSSDRIAAPVGNAPEFPESHSLPHSQTQFALWNSTTSGTFLKIEIISKFYDLWNKYKNILEYLLIVPLRHYYVWPELLKKYYDMWSIHKIYE